MKVDEELSSCSPINIPSETPVTPGEDGVPVHKETRREKKIQRKKMAFKTKLCRNYSRGHCQFGENCQFAHGREDLHTGNL